MVLGDGLLDTSLGKFKEPFWPIDFPDLSILIIRKYERDAFFLYLLIFTKTSFVELVMTMSVLENNLNCFNTF